MVTGRGGTRMLGGRGFRFIRWAATVGITDVELSDGLSLNGSSIAGLLGERGGLLIGGGLAFVEDAQEALPLVQLRHLMIR